MAGSNHVVKKSPTDRAAPITTAPTARTTMGMVMRGPDSWGRTGLPSASVVQRALPWKVMKNRRDM